MGGGKPTGRGPAPRAAIVGQPKRARLPRGRNSFLHTSLRAIGESRWTAVAASVFSRSRLWIAYRGQGFHSIFFAAREGGPLPSNSCNEPCSGNNPLRGGGGIPIQGEQPATVLVNTTTTSIIWVGYAPSLRKARPSSLMIATETSISGSSWRRNRGRSSPTGCRNGRSRPQGPARWNCRRSRISTRSATGMRRSSYITSMVSTTATTWRSSISPRRRS